MEAFPRLVWRPPGFRGLNASELTERLVLMARVGGFNPNRNNGRAHGDATLLAAGHEGGASEARVMHVSGH
jgi:hypothetical protein